jgi:hypothetical protein
MCTSLPRRVEMSCLPHTRNICYLSKNVKIATSGRHFWKLKVELGRLKLVKNIF